MKIRIILRSRVVDILLVLLLAGCVTTPQVITITPVIYQINFDRLWRATVDTLDELGFSISHADKNDGYITTEKRNTSRLEGLANATYGQQRMSTALTGGVDEERTKVSVRITKVESGFEVKIKTFIEHHEVNSGIDPRWVEVETNGKLEAKLQQKIAEKIK